MAKITWHLEPRGERKKSGNGESDRSGSQSDDRGARPANGRAGDIVIRRDGSHAGGERSIVARSNNSRTGDNHSTSSQSSNVSTTNRSIINDSSSRERGNVTECVVIDSSSEGEDSQSVSRRDSVDNDGDQGNSV